MTTSAFSKCVGESPAILDIREEIARVARTDAKVLVTGESGTGKELVACAVHASSDRAAGPFVPVNCAGLPETLLESELFGYLRGSFTGAYRDKPGKLEVAHNGTVFLDEIGEMTLRMQGLLLRFLETGELQKVGGYGETRRVNTRLVTATNRNLRGLINQGQFREDLFHRINVIHLVVPPLRERKTDIPILFEHFMREFAAGRKRNSDGAPVVTPQNIPVRKLSPEALSALREYSWPGNVRELQNVVERLVVNGRSDAVTLEELPADIRAFQGGAGRPVRERRRTVADDLYKRIVHDGECFWSTVYPLFMDREITRSNVRDIIRKGLLDARGNYKIVARLFNMPSEDYKKFLNFLRKHNCQLSFREYRENTGAIASRD
jgi:transcriptional regulator with PAS, ATPase and Fis domain